MSRLRIIMLILLPLMLTACCGTGGLLWGGTKCDNFSSPNWDNRHEKFVRWLEYEVGKPFQTSTVMCSSRFVRSELSPTESITYSYEHGSDCTYECIVDPSGVVISTSFKGTKEACSLTLN
jgi:hypothetical protein